jgi:hypothetical protein
MKLALGTIVAIAAVCAVLNRQPQLNGWMIEMFIFIWTPVFFGLAAIFGAGAGQKLQTKE